MARTLGRRGRTSGPRSRRAGPCRNPRWSRRALRVLDVQGGTSQTRARRVRPQGPVAAHAQQSAHHHPVVVVVDVEPPATRLRAVRAQRAPATLRAEKLVVVDGALQRSPLLTL